MPGGVEAVNGLFQVVAGRGGAEHHCAAVFFDACLQLLYLLCGVAYAYEQQSAGKRIERSGVAYLEFLKPEGALDMPFQFVDYLKGTPLAWLVDGDDNSGFLGHRVRISREV